MFGRSFFSHFAAILLMLVSVSAIAANSGVTYQGRIIRPDGSPLSGATAQFRMQIRSPDAANCLMYEELQVLDMRNTNGTFSLTIADGTGSRLDSTGWNLDRIFANRGNFSFAASSCTSGTTYAPNPSDGRSLVVLFKDETMAAWEPIPPSKINFVPFAFESKQIAGFTADSLLRVVDGAGDPLTGLAPLSNAQYSALMALANGTSTSYTKAGELNGVALPAMTSGEVLGWNGTNWVSTTSTPGANSIATTMLQTGAVTGAKLDPAISISTTGTVSSAFTTTRDFKIFATSPSTFYVGMVAPALASSYTLTWPMTAGSANQVLTTNGSGTLTWTTPAASAITALTGDVTASGTGSVAATVAAVAGSTAAQVHSAELLANAATASSTSGAIVKRDGTGNFAANIVTANGVALNNAGSVLNLLNPVGAAYTLTLPTGSGVSGQVLSTDGAGVTSWINQPVAPWTVQAPGINYMGGNVGIGTTSPTSKLTVAGSVNFGGTSYFGNTMQIQTTNGTPYSANTGFLPSAAVVVSAQNSQPTAGVAGYISAVARSTNGFQSSYFGSVSSASGQTPTTVIGQQVGSNGYVERLSIDPNGNVGIGTTSPQAAFDVSGKTDAIILPTGTSAQRPSSPVNGMARYNTTIGKIEFYDGGQWVSYLTQVNASAPSGTGGTGYFVLTNTSWDGNLGGLAGANAKCRTELSSYAWKNKPGTLDTSKVFAFLCDKSMCQNPQGLVNYYYAVANDTSVGGSGFSTNGSGSGPGDSFALTAPDRFGPYGARYWVGTRSYGPDYWATTAVSSYEDCSAWSTNLASVYSSTGDGSNTNYYRFTNYPSAYNETCNIPHRLICFVNP